MNGEPPPSHQVPVTTLAGTVSLTELLSELPLPGALVNDQSRSLLFHPRVAEEAQRHLSCKDSSLVSQLAQALARTSADHIELKEQYVGAQSGVELKSAPPLLKEILRCNAAAFSGKDESGGKLHGRTADSAGGQPNTNDASASSSPSTIVNHVNNCSVLQPKKSPGSGGLPAQVTTSASASASSIKKEVVVKEESKGLQHGEGAFRTQAASPDSGKNDGMKPVVKLVKLSKEDVKSFSFNVAAPKSNSTAPTKYKDHNSSKRSRSGREVRAKYHNASSSESEEEDKKKPIKYFKSREKEREEKKRKDKAERKRNRIEDDDEYTPEKEPKKARKDDYDEFSGFEDSDDEAYSKSKSQKSGNMRVPSSKKSEFSRKRLERKVMGGVGEKLSNEELMETGVYQRFTRIVEKVFDNTDEIDLNVELDEDGDVPTEYLIPKHELMDLCSESAKLKSLGAMALVPPERLVRLLNILEKNIRDGAKISPIVDEDDDDDDKLYVELAMERILRAMDASLTVLYILTANNMNKRAYLEDVIERCVQFAKFQLSNTIYPSFDPVYRIDNKDNYVGSMKRKRAHMKDVRDRNILGLYNKLHELVGLIADLLSIQTLTDTTVLQLSTLGVAPFFVENVAELQLSALRLVTKVFSKYDKHRRLLLDDILASIARLPSSKRSLRTYRLNSDENIQMLTALVLQLIQCVVELPDSLSSRSNKSTSSGNSVKESSGANNNPKEEGNKEKSTDLNVDRDVLVSHKYETAMGTAYSFLSVFLQKTGNRSEEIDYRPLFENFVQDLLLTVNKPEWPAAELLLSFLGKLLVQKFSNKNTDMSLRVSSLDCLGIVAARLRRDAVTSQLKVDRIDQIIQEVKEEENREAPSQSTENGSSEVNGPDGGSSTHKKKRKKEKGSDSTDESNPPCPDLSNEEEERTVFLQRVLLDWLAVNSEGESSLIHARHFYIGQWYRDAFSEILRQKRGHPSTPISSLKKSSHKKKRRKRRGESSEEETSESEPEEIDERNTIDEELKEEVTRMAEKRKRFLLSKVSPFPPTSSGARIQTLQTHIDYESAELITRYLASKRSFSQSFDSYLKQILRVLSESAIAVRTKAMKCLTMVVEVDSAVLARNDMQMGVHHSFLDHSTSVREAAVDLVGKFVLSRPELIDKYYDMIAARILDTGVSVRKRVIKIMKDICLEYPTFAKIPEICVKMIRRVNDEDGIKKLVQEVFQNMWFTPVREKPHLDKEALRRKVTNITEVVIACKETGLDWFEQLLHSMFRLKDDKEDVTKVVTDPPKALLTACKQIVDCLVNHILVLEEKGDRPLGEAESSKERNPETEDEKILENEPPSRKPAQKSASQRLVACLKTLYLFAKIRPQLLVDHAITLQPYLSLKCQTQGDYTMIGVVARTLELVVPLMEHPSETFLAQLEEDAVKLILMHDKTVISSCLALLGSIVNTVTKNYALIKDCFNKYYNFIVDYNRLHQQSPSDVKLEQHKPHFKRALYTVGLLLRHFDFKVAAVRCGLEDTITEHVIETLMYFMNLPEMDTKFFTLQSLGSVCIRHYELMMGERLKSLYHYLLLDPQVSDKLRVQTLQNIETYLQEEEIRMIREDQEWAKTKTKENLKEMCDIQSGMASAIIQVYLKQILECVISENVSVRHSALRVVQLVLAQGLVHPVQIVPYLICMSTDSEELVSHTADKQLQDIEKKYPGFINMKAMQGFRLSYRLQCLIQQDIPPRGYKQKPGEAPGAMNGFLYSIMRGTKQQRRAVAMSLLKQFDEQSRATLSELLYISDNLAHFPYQVMDEPHFIIHHIDIMISVTGTHLLQSFKEGLLPPPNAPVKINMETGKAVYLEDEEDDDATVDALVERLPQDLSPLIDCMSSSQGCLLLLMLKDHLKESYGITDNKTWHYSPSDTTKQFERGVSKKSISKFYPKAIILRIKEPKYDATNMDDKQKRKVVEEFLNFKDLMLKIDEEDDNDSEDEGGNKLPNHQVDQRTSRSQRLLQQSKKQSDVILLPGTHDGWEEKPEQENREEILPMATSVPPETDSKGESKRSPIKPLTIRTSQISLSSKDKHHHHHHRSSSHHHKSSHKKHKKKKKRKRYASESEDDDSEDSDFMG